MNKFSTKMGLYLKRNSSTILTFLGGIGVGVTAILAAQETPKAIQMMKDAAKEKGSDLTILEKAIVVTPCYAPAIVTGAATVACIFSANVLNQKQQARITSAYAMLDRYHKEYRNKLIELKGEEVDLQIRTEMARRYCDFHQYDLDVPDNKVIFYDEISGQSKLCYEREIMDAEYHMNRNFVLRGYASHNDFLCFLGMEQTDYGNEIGWSCSDGYYWIDFEHRLIDGDSAGPDVYIIDYVFPPHADYLQDWE